MQLLATHTGMEGLIFVRLGPQIVCLSLENNLCGPFAVPSVQVNASMSTGVAGNQPFLCRF